MNDELRQRIDGILLQYEGQETTIAEAGRENTRAVNRIAHLAALRRVDGETTFRRSITRYNVDGLAEILLIGAERAGGGVWRLIARWEAAE